MKAIIMAGGLGSRLGELTSSTPKPLLQIEGKPILLYQIENLRRYHITDITIVVGYLGHKIRDYFGDGSEYGVNISYFVEESPLGTAGSLAYLVDNLPDTFILLYGDLVFDIDFSKLLQFHIGKKAEITMTVHPNSHPYDSDLVVLSKKHVVEKIIKKNENRTTDYNNCVNAGIYVLTKRPLSALSEGEKQDLETNIIQPAISNGRIYGYKTTEYIKDMGTIERYRVTQEQVRKNIVFKRNIANKQKAVFLDRDGTINNYVGLLSSPEQLQIEEDVYLGLEIFNQSEFLSIVITNQPVVARNLCSVEELDLIHRKLETLLGQRGVYIDDLYYCPHHPDKGYPKENKLFKIRCQCRKPEIGLIKQAAIDYNIDLSQSYFIGDTTVDILTGKNANMTTVLLGTGQAGKDGKYPVSSDLYFDNLYQAACHIVNN
ncbi:D,D-heptose 1,7-bisphosphate phosphatase [Fischerella thermalis CCMEE 5273]|nr:D,D-heptose 1,7-bisphosphate phosphatase [Fischerella thermalis CCMEE 5273]